MTGEVTLRGRVRPIGGLKEKMLAAHRGGIHHLIFPKDNEKDLREIPLKIREELELTAVDTMDEVLKAALQAPPEFFERLATTVARDPLSLADEPKDGGATASAESSDEGDVEIVKKEGSSSDKPRRPEPVEEEGLHEQV